MSFLHFEIKLEGYKFFTFFLNFKQTRDTAAALRTLTLIKPLTFFSQTQIKLDKKRRYSFHRLQTLFNGKISVSAISAQLHLMCNLTSFRKKPHQIQRIHKKASPCSKLLTFYEMCFLRQKTQILNKIKFNATTVF